VIHFVIPARDEAPNVPRLMADLVPRVRRFDGRVIVVDDGSIDGTAEALERHRDGLDLAILRHPRNLGVGAALETGLRAALDGAADDDAIVTLEADATSDLADLPALVAGLDAGSDVVLASPHAPGGAIAGAARWRLAASKLVSRSFRAAGGPPGVHTLSSLYRAYRAGALRRIAARPRLVREPGFPGSVALLLDLHDAGCTVSEIPTVNRWDRRAGASKMSLRATVPSYARLLASRVARRR
jgi:dolichol-phosphate mannosyltransferase